MYSNCCYEDLYFIYDGSILHILRNIVSLKGHIRMKSICNSTGPVQKGLYTTKTIPSLDCLCSRCDKALPGFLIDKALMNLHGFVMYEWITQDHLGGDIVKHGMRNPFLISYQNNFIIELR